MPEIKTQRQAIEALAKWGGKNGAPQGHQDGGAKVRFWAAEYYASLMRENVAAILANPDEDNTQLDVSGVTKAATWQTQATIQSLVEGACDD